MQEKRQGKERKGERRKGQGRRGEGRIKGLAQARGQGRAWQRERKERIS